jgi:PKD repeat protein
MATRDTTMRHTNRANQSMLVRLAVPILIVGCSDPASVPLQDPTSVPPIATNLAPSASFSTNCTLLDCVFNAAASTDSDGSLADYQWDFGDGNSAVGVNPSHSYSAAGQYSILLIVTDNDGAAGDSFQVVDVVSAGVSNNPPAASFTSACTDLNCNFDASGSSDSDGTIVSYDWTFGDGQFGTGQFVNHVYAASGSYFVTIDVTDNIGAASSSTQNISVSGGAVAVDGQSLYQQKCSTCHGADALGGTLARISIVGKTAAEITNAIATIPNMSSLSGLTAEEIQAIADYLATL